MGIHEEGTHCCDRGMTHVHVPFLHLIQTNADWCANAGFLLPPLPLHQLLPHQQVDHLFGLVQVLPYICQDALRKQR